MSTGISTSDFHRLDRHSIQNLDLRAGSAHWTEDDCLLYALGVGAGSVDPVLELNLTTENSEGISLQAVPSFGITLVNGGPSVLEPLGVRGQDVLLVEEKITLSMPIPTGGSVATSSRVVDVADHPRGFLMRLENSAADTNSGQELFKTVNTTLILAERSVEDRAAMKRPIRQLFDDSATPHRSVKFSIAQNQCLLYRLASGRNPLHSDPVVSRRAGYDVPLLHGRCTLGFAARHVITELCDGDATRLTSLGGAFSAPVFPGDELVMRIWTGPTGRYDIKRTSDNAVVMNRGTFTCQN